MMSLAYVMFLLWVPVALASRVWPDGLAAGLVPLERRGQVRLGLLALGGLIALLALLTGGTLPGAFAALGVLAVFPEPLTLGRDAVVAGLRRWIAARRIWPLKAPAA